MVATTIMIALSTAMTSCTDAEGGESKADWQLRYAIN